MMWFLVVLCYSHGVCVAPADPAEQRTVLDQLQHDMWGAPGQRNTCRSSLFSTCAPWIDDA